mmetsp:Transcript_26550/g.65978  ORF Transcript_26550/g.65978 Transcript_26550/m.65978 type:complete len:85 (-) Transcript_26550:1334-1588(-)
MYTDNTDTENEQGCLLLMLLVAPSHKMSSRQETPKRRSAQQNPHPHETRPSKLIPANGNHSAKVGSLTVSLCQSDAAASHFPLG